MKNAYDLAFQVQQLADDSHDPVLRLKALELADAVRREKDPQYTPQGWTKTGIYGSCTVCADYLRGCGIGYGPDSICPDCKSESTRQPYTTQHYRQRRVMAQNSLIYRNGRTFRVKWRHAERGLPCGWELSGRDIEPDTTWTFLSLWKTKREAVEAAECFT